MSVLLPIDAKYAFFIDNKQAFHHEWNVNWSFTFKLDDPKNIIIYLTDEYDNNILTESGEPIALDLPSGEYGFCTFLTKTPTISSFMLGHYMGFFKNLSAVNGEVAIAFDTTGLFALSSTNYPYGVTKNDVKTNSLIIRDRTGVVYNESLPTFQLASNTERTFRFRYVNKNEVVVEYKEGSGFYIELVRTSINTNLSGDDKLYPAFFYSSPLSSLESSTSTLYMKNFHVQGNINNPTYS